MFVGAERQLQRIYGLRQNAKYLKMGIASTAKTRVAGEEQLNLDGEDAQLSRGAKAKTKAAKAAVAAVATQKRQAEDQEK